jgi:magnesium-transporting ATPase (P-type)
MGDSNVCNSSHEGKLGDNNVDKLLSQKKVDLSFDPKERQGLTTAQAEELYISYGYNELPEITISLVYVFFLQFTGTMPYMMEFAAIIAIAVQDYADFGIIIGMLCSNAIIGFQEQLKAAKSLVR